LRRENMKRGEFTFKDAGGVEIFVYKWLPEEDTKVKGAVQIAHGMAEHAARYERFADSLTNAGYIVYANDHRGHGKTAGSLENVGYLGEDGYNWMIKDMKQLNDIIREQNPGIRVFLFGHSMGSLLSQKYISLYGDTLKGVVLSGTSGKQGLILDLGIMIAKREMKKNGPKAKSPTLNNMTFGANNKAFEPGRTSFDWLNRDEAEVDKYIDDPYCGGVFSTEFFYDFARGFKEIHRRDIMKRIPRDLPVYFMSGDKDPVGKECKTVVKLIETYKNLGIKDVTYKFYKDGRHEMLNEKNRDEVTADIIKWLDTH
jgi:alpha-beta hydrolase superfamily lysophospholipase